MKVVQNTFTGRLIYRESPNFKKGLGIKNAVLHELGNPDELKEITVTQTQWEAELALQAQEQPPTLQEKLDLLTLRVHNLEKVIIAKPSQPPSS